MGTLHESDHMHSDGNNHEGDRGETQGGLQAERTGIFVLPDEKALYSLHGGG